MIYIFPDVVAMIEVFLIGLVVALIGAGGYVFFIYSMHADRNARLRAKYYQNPWETLTPQEEDKDSKKPRLSKGMLIWLIALIISSLMLFLFILAIKCGWIVS